MKRASLIVVLCGISLTSALGAADPPNVQRFTPPDAFFSIIIPPGWSASRSVNNFDIIEYVVMNPRDRQQAFSITEFKHEAPPDRIMNTIVKNEESKGISGSYSSPILVDRPMEGTLVATIQVSTGTQWQYQHFYFVPAQRTTMFVEISPVSGPSPEFSEVLDSFKEKEGAAVEASAQAVASSEHPPLGKPLGLLFVIAALSYTSLRRFFQDQIQPS